MDKKISIIASHHSDSSLSEVGSETAISKRANSSAEVRSLQSILADCWQEIIPHHGEISP